MEERTVHLKIKVQSLVDEAKNIRREANKTSGKEKWGLNHHRTSVVRPHTRHNLLAYGILRCIPYSVMEKKCRETPDFSWVSKIAKRFGASDADILEWMEDAKMHISGHQEAA